MSSLSSESRPQANQRRPMGGVSLTEGEIRGHLIRLTVPMMLGMASMMVAAVIDTVYVGWIGTAELAALSFSFPVVMVMVSLSMGVGIGATSVIARTLGSGDRAKVRQLATHSFLLVLLISSLSALFGFVFAAPLFTWLGATDEMLPLVVRYMQIWFLGLPFFALPMVGTSIMRAVGSARAPGVIMTSASIIQVVLAPLLMFGAGSFAGFGFEGSALAFVISRVATLVLAVYLVGWRMKLLTAEGLTLDNLLVSWREVMRISVPSTLSQLIGPVSFGFVIVLLAPYGAAVVASMGVASRIESLATMVLMSLSGSLSPFIGQNFGAREDQRVADSLRLCYRFSLIYAVAIAAFLALTGRWWVSLINGDLAVIDATYVYLLLVPISYGLLGIGMCASTLFMALGKPMPTLLMSIGRMFVLYVPLAWLFDQWFGFAGVYAATAIANVAMGFVAFYWARRTFAQEIHFRDSVP